MSQPTSQEKEAAFRYLEKLFFEASRIIESEAANTEQVDEARQMLADAQDLGDQAQAIRESLQPKLTLLRRPKS
jgi:hypothetical protein